MFTSPPTAAPLSFATFSLDALTPQQMVELRGLERNKDCRINGKVSRETKSFVNKLEKQTVTASLSAVRFIPTLRTGSYNMTVIPPQADGSLVFADGKTAGEKMIEQGLAAPPGGEALPRWYKSPNCQP